jgi:hypothetical protein
VVARRWWSESWPQSRNAYCAQSLQCSPFNRSAREAASRQIRFAWDPRLEKPARERQDQRHDVLGARGGSMPVALASRMPCCLRAS